MVPVAVACAWCQRVRTGSGWESADADTPDLAGPGVTHGICPECLERETRGLPLATVQEATAPHP